MCIIKSVLDPCSRRYYYGNDYPFTCSVFAPLFHYTLPFYRHNLDSFYSVKYQISFMHLLQNNALCFCVPFSFQSHTMRFEPTKLLLSTVKGQL